MALTCTRQTTQIGAFFVLAPERYDPRRSINGGGNAVLLSEIVDHVRETVSSAVGEKKFLVLDTSDVHEGIIVGRKKHTADVGSMKKVPMPGDVLISRLRPYLRQVAFVDDAIPNLDGAKLVCSTEFFILRSKGSASLSFLIPFLLSDQVQEVLAVSQEGGHHPRFDQETLFSLPVPKRWVQNREEVSRAVEKAIKLYRESESTIFNLIKSANMNLNQS